ncbi:hypothetical protein ACFXDE_23155 [Kitasatospora sp. NPDC059408]|uniref:hypothetical protein n=1 Tax=Kitasatospora sp. NPDC059408 TaxID=3346823 RepID=UPI00368CBC93
MAFVRRDLVLNSVQQNAQQFLARHRAYELRIQARGIVVFPGEAAEDSVGDPKRWSDRLLTPPAMCRALPTCSAHKIAAMELENAPVGKLFRDRRDLPDEVRKVPFALESVQLERADTRLLEASGALFRENDRYWIPEIYCHGLKFGVSGGGRPRVVPITKLIRDRDGA